MSFNSVCNHTREKTNRTPATRSSDCVNHLYDYRPNLTPLSPVIIINRHFKLVQLTISMFQVLRLGLNRAICGCENLKQNLFVFVNDVCNFKRDLKPFSSLAVHYVNDGC